MSVSKIREIREQINKLNEDANPLRAILADKSKTDAEVREAKTKLDKVLDESDKLILQRDELIADAEREVRSGSLDLTARDTKRPREAAIGSAEKRNAVTVYNRALKNAAREGTDAVTKRARAALTPEVRSVIEDLEERYWQAFREHSIAVLQGDPSACSQEDRAIMLGQVEEFRELGAGQGKVVGNLTAREMRDMGISTNTLGGYFVPRGFVYEVEEALKYYGPMLQICEIMDTATGNPLPYPTDNDTTVMGEITGEAKQVTEQDVTIGQIVFSAEKFDTKMVKASLELLQDSAFDIPNYLKKKFGIRLGRILNNKFTLGNGASANPVEPTGLITAMIANNGAANATPGQPYGTPLVASGASTNDGGAETGGSSIGTSDIINLEHCVDPLYRRGAAYMMHDQTLRKVKTLLDKYGRPIWKQSLAVGSPDELNGYPYFINNDMATIALNAVTVSFGDHKKYLIRRVKELGVVTLQERFADYGQVAYIGFARYDGNLLDAGTHPVTYLQMAAA